MCMWRLRNEDMQSAFRFSFVVDVLGRTGNMTPGTLVKFAVADAASGFAFYNTVHETFPWDRPASRIFELLVVSR